MNIFAQRLISKSILFIMLVLCCSSLLAEEKKKTYKLDPNVHAQLIGIHKQIDEGQNGEALKRLKKLISSNNLKAYDSAVAYQTMGFAKSNIGEFSDAAKHFIKALSLDALPAEVTHGLNYSTAQLLIHIDKTKEGLKYLSKWFANEPKATGDAHILAATAYYYLKDYKQLIIHVEKALALSSKPPLSWYELLLAGYYEIKEYKKSVTLLETIINKHPKKTNYWLQLAEIYQRLEQDKKALAVYELAYAKGLLQKDDINRLISNYLYLEMPYKAAIILEKEMAIGDINPDIRTLTLLADSWLLAQENQKAEPVFKEIIKKYNDDHTRLRLGQLYIEAEEWKKVIEVLDVEFKSEGKVLLSKVNLLLGIAQYHSKNLDKATRAFTHALSDKSTAEQASWWLDHLKNKTTKTQDS
jgi:tetratricopeptide (TPR) repeat protein